MKQFREAAQHANLPSPPISAHPGAIDRVDIEGQESRIAGQKSVFAALTCAEYRHARCRQYATYFADLKAK